MPTPKCVSCGLCCKMVGMNVAAAKDAVSKGNKDLFIKEVAAFPYELTADGTCTKLQPDGLCSVYQDRPDICSIHKVWAIFFRKVDEQKFYDDSWVHCKNLMNANNYPIPHL